MRRNINEFDIVDRCRSGDNMRRHSYILWYKKKKIVPVMRLVKGMGDDFALIPPACCCEKKGSFFLDRTGIQL